MNAKKKIRWDGKRIIVSVLILILALFLFKNFAEAVADGMTWKAMSEWSVIAPDFIAEDLSQAKKIGPFTLPDRFGHPVSLSQFEAADILVVNLWSTGCPPCERELPSLAEFDRRISKLGKIVLLTITIDADFADVAHYFPQGTDLRILFDPEKKVVGKMFGTKKFPETFILDKNRRIRARFDGERDWHAQEMLDYVKSFL